jgi:hypothetical protein
MWIKIWAQNNLVYSVRANSNKFIRRTDDQTRDFHRILRVHHFGQRQNTDGLILWAPRSPFWPFWQATMSQSPLSHVYFVTNLFTQRHDIIKFTNTVHTIYNIYLLLASWTVTSNKPWTKDGALLLAATSNGSSFAVPPISLEADTNFENFSRNSWISTSLENISVVYGCLWWTGSRWREHIQLAKEQFSQDQTSRVPG